MKKHTIRRIVCFFGVFLTCHKDLVAITAHFECFLLFSLIFMNILLRFWIPFPNRSVSVLGHLCTELVFCYLIYSGSIDDASAAALLKGAYFVRTLAGSPAYKRFRLWRKPWRKGEFTSPAQVRSIGVPGQSAGLTGGIPKGALPPLCRRGGGVHRGGTPSKGSLSYAPFCLLFRRGKSRPGVWGRGGPTKTGPGGGAPVKF